MIAHLLKKIGFALWEAPRAFRLIRQPRILMTLLVKNEADVLEANLRFHRSMGVDGFLITDNNSTDRTPEIIRRYQEKGWILEVIHETATNYEQKRWVDRMAWLAKTRYGADWIINADADELWYAPSGSLKQAVSALSVNVLHCEVRGVYPEEGKPFWQWSQRVVPTREGENFDLSPYSVFAPQRKKVMHKAAGYLQIAMGNHKVAMLPRRCAYGEVRVYHYTVRGRAHFLQKMENGGRQLEQNKSKHGGRHWRYFYELYKAGRLEQEYDRVIGKNQYAELCQTGHILSDSTIPDYFARHPELIESLLKP